MHSESLQLTIQYIKISKTMSTTPNHMLNISIYLALIIKKFLIQMFLIIFASYTKTSIL